jgi:hypothetical protein
VRRETKRSPGAKRSEGRASAGAKRTQGRAPNEPKARRETNPALTLVHFHVTLCSQARMSSPARNEPGALDAKRTRRGATSIRARSSGTPMGDGSCVMVEARRAGRAGAERTEDRASVVAKRSEDRARNEPGAPDTKRTRRGATSRRARPPGTSEGDGLWVMAESGRAGRAGSRTNPAPCWARRGAVAGRARRGDRGQSSGPASASSSSSRSSSGSGGAYSAACSTQWSRNRGR